MADEIVAKYKVDVDDASKSLQDLANQAKRSEDALKKSGQAANDSFVKGSDGAKRLQAELARQPKTLAEMELKLRNLRELLRDDAKIGTAGFKQVTRAIKETEAEIDKANSKLKETGKQGTSLIGMFKSVALAVGLAFGVQQIVSFGKEAVQLAAKAEGVKRAFDRIGSASMLDGLRAATRGTVTDLILMQNAVKADNFKIPLDQLATLFQFAQSRARATGESVDYLVDSLILGIGRKSIPILDNLGISAVELKQKLGDTAKSAATIGDVAEAVGKIATESLAKTGREADTTADRLARLATIWNNFKTDSGGAIVDVATRLAQLFELIPEDVKRTNDYMESLAGKSALALDKMGKAQRQAVLNAEAAYKAALRSPNDGSGDDLQKEYFIQLDLLKVIQETYKTRLAEVRSAKDLEAVTTDQLELERKRKELHDGDNKQIKNVFYYTEAIKELNEEINAEGTAIADIMPLLAQRAELQEALTKLTTEQATGMNLLNQELAAMQKELAAAEIGGEGFWDVLFRIQNKVKEISDAQAMTKLAEALIPDVDDTSQQDAKIQSELNRESAKFKAIEKLRTDHLSMLDESISKEIEAEFERIDAIEQAEKDARERKAQADAEAREQAQTAMLAAANATIQIIGMISQAQQQSTQNELNQLQNALDAGQITREEYDQKRRNLMREQAKQDKEMALLQAAIGTAASVVEALPNFALALITAALGAAQIAIIASQPLPQFAKGVIDLKGEGTETSDSIHARLSRGESVMTAKETKTHRPILEAIRKGTLEKMIAETYVRPAVDAALLSGFADIGRSADLNGLTAKLSDHNIIAAMDRNRQATTYGLKMLADEIKMNKRANRRGYA